MSLIGAAIGIGVGASAAAAIGTGLVVGGVAAGAGAIASGILAKQAADQKQAAYRNLAQWAGGQYSDLGTYQQKEQDAILKTFLDDRSANMTKYSGGYNQLLSDFNSRYQELESTYAQQSAGLTASYREGMQGVRAIAESGRTNTLAAIDQATNTNVQRMQQSQAFTGLSGTSFGQSGLAAQQSQGALQKGVVEEQYSSQLAGIQQAMVQGTTALEQQRLGTMTQMSQARVGGGLTLQQQLLQQQFGQSEDVARQSTALRSDFLNAQVNVERERVARVLGPKAAAAQYAGSGYQTAAAIVGGATSGIASGMMGMIQPYMAGAAYQSGMNSQY